MKDQVDSMKIKDKPDAAKRKRKSVYGTEVSTRVPNFLVPLLVLDRKLTSYLSVCANKDSTFVLLRPHMKLIEISGHGVPWLAGCVAVLYMLRDRWAQEITINIFVALLLDIIFVGLLKAITRRSRPANNDMDMFVTISVDNYSFPSGHASRAVMLFLIVISRCDISMLIFLLLAFWFVFVCISRVLLGRHHIGDVLGGVILGFLEFGLMNMIWMSPETANSIVWLFYDYDTADA